MASKTSPFATPTKVGTTTRIDPASLATYHKNPRRGDITAIAGSLKVNDQYKPITVNVGTFTGRTNEVLAGNHTLMAFRTLAEAHPEEARWNEILVHWVDVDDDRAARIVAADNRTSELGTNDNEALLELLQSVPDLEGTGYASNDLLELLTACAPPTPPIADPDAAPRPHRTAERVDTGQQWQLGPHKLLVGDSTDVDTVKAWLGADVPDCVWTDPPYGVDYVGKTADALTIKNDGAVGLDTLIEAMTRVAVAVCRPGAAMYVAAPPGPQFGDFVRGLTAGGYTWRQTLAWVKNTIVLGRSDYHYRHEAIFYGFTPSADGVGRLGRGGDRWQGDDSAASTLFHDKPPANEDHPTMKPVSLVAECLSNSCPAGGLVLDLFGGSGTTLIAAHTLGRRAALVELDPVYAEVIIRRYEEATGDTAVQVA